MSSSQSVIESSSSTDAEYNEISDYELEIEEFESISDKVSHSDSEAREEASSSNLAAPEPYDDEPLADEEWIRNYNEKRQIEATLLQTLNDRLNGKVSIADW